MSASGMLASALELAKSGEPVRIQHAIMDEAAHEHRYDHETVEEFVKHVELCRHVLITWDEQAWTITLDHSYTPTPRPTVNVIGVTGQPETREFDRYDQGKPVPVLGQGESFMRTSDGLIHILAGD